ncbi:MAG TPA: LytTR family DNA-binding domain-containing protein [Gemmatimonadaceae bacterium]|nr:LytTR family DNA-binding domain-containing protein [Gemmatimonadaceae bacterium]
MSADLRPTRVLIVDDEPLARAHLRELLAESGGVEVMGECGDGREAVRRILAEAPDLVLLDVQIPELDGFGVVREIGAERMPMVIFVTAYDEYALQAFDVSALAYLLKPVNREKFSNALERARTLMRAGSSTETASRLGKLLERMGESRPQGDRLSLKIEGRVLFVGVDEIDWLEASDNHVKVHIGQRTHQVRSTMASFEERLPPGKFLRIHRSTMVNVRRIVEVQPWFAGDYVFILAGGARLTSGRSYRQAIHDFMDRQL